MSTPKPPSIGRQPPRPVVDIAAQKRNRLTGIGPDSGSGSGREEGRKLLVGREISVSGEISACDHLVVEGSIEARIADCRTMEIHQGGVFKGSAEIEEATISGRFEGELTVKGKLVLRADGLVSGTIRYGTMEVEPGGRLVGTLEPLESTVTPLGESDRDGSL